jgi:hypothetical protein
LIVVVGQVNDLDHPHILISDVKSGYENGMQISNLNIFSIQNITM